MTRYINIIGMFVLAVLAWPAAAEDAIQVQRHELMEGVGDAAKPLGGMLKGEMAFDAAVVMESFRTFEHAASVAGSMFPEGSETGYDTKALPAIWSDRAGFDAALADFAAAVDGAIAAAPQNVEGLQGAAGPVFKACKGCHENYRAELE